MNRPSVVTLRLLKLSSSRSVDVHILGILRGPRTTTGIALWFWLLEGRSSEHFRIGRCLTRIPSVGRGAADLAGTSKTACPDFVKLFRWLNGCSMCNSQVKRLATVFLSIGVSGLIPNLVGVPRLSYTTRPGQRGDPKYWTSPRHGNRQKRCPSFYSESGPTVTHYLRSNLNSSSNRKVTAHPLHCNCLCSFDDC